MGSKKDLLAIATKLGVDQKSIPAKANAKQICVAIAKHLEEDPTVVIGVVEKKETVKSKLKRNELRLTTVKSSCKLCLDLPGFIP